MKMIVNKQTLVMLALLACIQLASAQTFIPLYSFTGGIDGDYPQASLIQANDGNLYGTTTDGGSGDDDFGVVFRVTTSGALTPIYSFTGGIDGGNDGGNPFAGLVQANDGNLYGTTYLDGSNFNGTVFRVTTNGTMTRLYSFMGGNDGGYPLAGLVQASDGALYGTTQRGGTNGDGTVFRITTNGVYKSLWSFTGGSDGNAPFAGLVQASDGNLYGTTLGGGTDGYGTVFRITTNGVLTPLYSFTGNNDGGEPRAALMQASDGNLYGTTSFGNPPVPSTVFRITTNDVLTTINSFAGSPNYGYQPEAGLVQAGDGNLYGTTEYGGTNGDGTIFRITTSGTLTELYSFTGGNDGANPVAGLALGRDGNLYGTAPKGGVDGAGTVFELALPPPTASILTLSFSFSGNKGVLIGPSQSTNYVLQSTTNLASPNWVTIRNPMPANGVTVTNSLPAQYFRLAAP